MNLADGPMVGLDTETTGVNTEEDRIVTATVVYSEPGQTSLIYNWLIDPGIDIPTSASDVHGVLTAVAQRDGMAPADALDQIVRVLATHWTPDVPLVVYNAPYDLTLIDRELSRHLGTWFGFKGPTLDPLTIDRAVDRYRRGKRTLTAVSEHYGVTLEAAHTSMRITQATVDVMRAIARKYPRVIGEVPLTVLDKQQKTWYHNWAMNFASYLIRSAHELSADEEEKLRNDVQRIRADARHWPMIPRRITKE